MKAFVVGPRTEMSSDLLSLINCISERAAEVRWRGMIGTTAQATAATQVAGRAPKRRCGGCRAAAVRLEPQSPYRRR